MRSIAIVLSAILAVVSFSQVQATIIHVPGDSSTIQAGINGAVEGDTVLVSDNTYTGPQNRNLDFKGKNILLISENGPQVTIIDCEESGRGFCFHSHKESTVVVQGFTIKRGYGGDGGGLDCHWSRPTMRNCIFMDNVAESEGGGVLIDGASPTFEYCAFINNYAGSEGGAVSCNQTHLFHPSFTNCTFFGNRSRFNEGGGIWCDDSSPMLQNCIMAFNLGGRGVYCSDPFDQPTLDCCDLYGNVGGDWVGNIADQANINGNFSVDPLFCDTSAADFHLLYNSRCQPENNKCGLVGAYGVGCIDVQFPIAQRINYGGTTLDTIVTSAAPEIFWSYYDTAATTQMEYEIEVGTDWDWTVAEIWSSGPVVSSDTSVVYDGAPLSDHVTYYLRIRLNDGSTWGTWRYAKFVTRLTSVVHVPADEPTIQAGIDRALVGDTVLVSDDIYTGEGNRDIEFGGKGIVLKSENGPDFTIIDCQGSVAERHRGFSFYTRDSAVIVEGFTIQGGNHYDGGGVRCRHSTVTLRNCIFSHNSGSEGGGAYVYCSDSVSVPTIIECEFFQNRATSGGGAYCELSGRYEGATFVSCTFTQDSASLSGGGVYCESTSPTFTDCTFKENYAGGYGGGISCLYAYSPVIQNCTFNGNSAGQGGALSFEYHTAELNNCLFNRNSADDGGALFLRSSSPMLTSCTFAGNSGLQGGAVYCKHSSVPTLENCIIAFSPEGEAVHCASATDDPTLTCCDLYGNAGGDWIGCIADQAGINGNFSLDPLFCDTSAADFRLDHSSPCTPENNECGSLIGALGIGCAGTNQPPGMFSLLFPPNKAFTPLGVHFKWETADDPDLSDQVTYDLYVSTSYNFIPDQTEIYTDLPTSEHAVTLDLGSYFWKVKAKDNWGAETWSQQFRSFVVTGIHYSTGDFNMSGSVDAGDVVSLVGFLYRSGPAPDSLELGDVNCDHTVNGGDVVFLINYLFKEGPPPCEPQQRIHDLSN